MDIPKFEDSLPIPEEKSAIPKFEDSLPLEPVQAEEPSKNRGFLTSAEVEQIAKNRKVDAAELKALVPFYNIDLDDNTEYAKRVAGFLSEGVASGIPTFINKKLEKNTSMRDALDDLRDLVDRQKTKTQMAVEMGAGLLATGGIVKGASSVAKGLGTAAQIATGGIAGAAGAGLQGAQAGLAHSKEGEELKDAAIGAGFGVALAGALPLAKAIRKEYRTLTGKEAADAAEAAKDKIVQFAEKKMAANADYLSAQNSILSKDAGSVKDLASFKQLEDASTLMDAVVLPDSKTGKEALLEQMKAAGIESADELEQRAFIAMRKQQEELRNLGGYLKTGNEEVRLDIDDAIHTIYQKVKQEGADTTSKLVRDFQEIRAAQSAMHDLADQGLAGTKEIRNDFFSYMANKVGDAAAYVGPKIDRQLGTNFTRVIDRLAEKNNRLSVITHTASQIADDIRKATPKNSNDRIGQWLDGKRQGLVLTEAEKQIADKWEKLFAQGLKQAREMGSPIEKRDYYLPHMMMDFKSVMGAMDTRLSELSRGIGRDLAEGIDAETFYTLKPSATFQEYLQGLSILTGEKIDTAKSFNKALRMMENPAELTNRYGTIASAAMQRIGDMPDFLREKDISTLYKRWTYNTFRHTLFREDINAAKKMVRIAAARGDKPSAQYLQNWVIDMSGGNRDGTFAKMVNTKMLNAAISLQRKAADESRPLWQRKGFQALSEMPEMLGLMSQNIYPNVLGASVKSLFTNVFQPAAMGLPELGGAYGTKVTTKGYLKALADTGNMTQKLKEMGKLGAGWSPATARQMEEGLLQGSPALRGASGALKKITDASMFLYEKSEVLNKMVIHHMAEEVSTDLIRYLKGNTKGLASEMGKAAQDFVKTMPASYQRQMRQAVSSGNEELIRKTMGDYMQSKIIFNYSKASMSEFGRSMGPLFTTFLKWPTAISGDMLRTMEEHGPVRGAVANASKYLLPWYIYNTANEMVTGGEPSQRQEALMGKGGLTRLSPAGNVTSIIRGDILTPPAVDVPVNVAKGFYDLAATGDTKSLQKAAFSAAQTYGPGAGIIRFITEDAPAIVTGEKAVNLKEKFIGE